MNNSIMFDGFCLLPKYLCIPNHNPAPTTCFCLTQWLTGGRVPCTLYSTIKLNYK